MTIVAPPYHVQSTAGRLREGFPYFPYHDSVSVLWSERWRPFCATSNYPFMDADVADFDPIFAELIATSNDDPAILSRPDDYAKPFSPVAQRLVADAEAAESAGDTESARDLYLRAAAVYRIARFPINRSSLTQQAWDAGKAAYEKGASLLDPPSVSVDIEFSHVDAAAGDLDVPIRASLRKPKGRPPQGGWPVLLFICGLDAYRTDNTPRVQQHIDDGFATLSFEIPGTGDCPAAPADPRSPDRLMSSVIDWVGANAEQHDFDVERIAARGISTGGYYAFRVAHTHADRLSAVAAQGGGAHHMFDAGWIRAQNQMDYPFALGDALAYKFGFRDGDPARAVEDYAAGAAKFSLLDEGLLEGPSCRLLAVNGMEDSIFPIEDSFIVTTRGVDKDLIVRANKGHMGNPGGEEAVYQWLRERLARIP